ncbi:MAG: hypothetical protein HY225_02380 [Candidatus Vogelbacteria bacterium]|nr:hypothetical protein [Candidatus Vogelbacteria bacterium]
MIQIFNLTINEFIFKVTSKVQKIYIKYSFDPRPSSCPYLSGDGYRKTADHIYDETTKTFQPQNVKRSDVIYVRYDFLKDFFAKIHPKIQYQYILLSHNNDEWVDERYLSYIDDKIIKWYAQNVTVHHPKLFPLPTGLQNLYNYNYGIINVYEKLNNRLANKKNKILFGFSIGKKEYEKERLPALQSLRNNPSAEEIKSKMVQISYFELLNEYKFVASPPGIGIESHRTYEAMYLRTIPIVKKSLTTDYYYNLGMPMWIIDDWRELENFTETQLSDKYDSLKDRFNNRTIFMDYWIDKIHQK